MELSFIYLTRIYLDFQFLVFTKANFLVCFLPQERADFLGQLMNTKTFYSQLIVVFLRSTVNKGFIFVMLVNLFGFYNFAKSSKKT